VNEDVQESFVDLLASLWAHPLANAMIPFGEASLYRVDSSNLAPMIESDAFEEWVEEKATFSFCSWEIWNDGYVGMVQWSMGFLFRVLKDVGLILHEDDRLILTLKGDPR
jgi:hypothetical protein